MKRLRYENAALDPTDARILRHLVEDARISIAALARKLRFSAPSIAERVKRLEEAGVVQSYTAVMNPAALGLAVSAYVRIKPVPGELQRVLQLVESIEAVVRCDRVTGDDCLIARVHVAAIADLEAVVDRLAPYATTSTSVIQSTPVPYRLAAFATRA